MNTKPCLRRLLLGTVVLVALAGVLWRVRAPLLSAAGAWLAAGAEYQPVDYLLVMPGDQTTRPFAAAALVRQGWVEKVLIPTNVDHPAVQQGIVPPTHEIIRRILTLRGVPPDQIVVLGHRRTNSSWDDLQALADHLADHPEATVGIVTNDYHVRRTRWTARRVLGRSAPVRVFGVPTDGFGPGDWWHYYQGVWMYGAEFGKLFAYWVVYGEPVFWLSLAAVSLLIVLIAKRPRVFHVGRRQH